MSSSLCRAINLIGCSWLLKEWKIVAKAKQQWMQSAHMEQPSWLSPLLVKKALSSRPQLLPFLDKPRSWVARQLKLFKAKGVFYPVFLSSCCTVSCSMNELSSFSTLLLSLFLYSCSYSCS